MRGKCEATHDQLAGGGRVLVASIADDVCRAERRDDAEERHDRRDVEPAQVRAREPAEVYDLFAWGRRLAVGLCPAVHARERVRRFRASVSVAARGPRCDNRGMSVRARKVLLLLVAAAASALASACRSAPPAPPEPFLDASTVAPPSAPPAARSARPDADVPAALTHAAGPSVQGEPCLRRDDTNDAKCADPRSHFFVWDEHACAVTRTSVAEVSKRCDAIGPHRAMNIANWCCP